jgi:predicted transcriptional regulator of viral defense system
VVGMDLVPEAAEPVYLSRDLRRAGLATSDLRLLRRTGELQQVRRGAYARTAPADAGDAHRLLLRATMSLLADDACLSHTSSALLHGLPWWADTLSRVHVIRSRTGGGRRDPLVHVHPALLEPGDRVEIDGVSVTSLARTTADCLRTLPYRRAVALGDAALRLGLSRDDLAEQLHRAARRVGVSSARRAAAFIDGRAESVGESYSRVVLHELCLPPPDLQVDVRDASGQLVGRCDFGWVRYRTLGEFDGKVKYGRLLREGQEAGDVVFDEKVREDELRGLGNEVVRWIDADLRTPARLKARIFRAFARGGSR